MKKWKTQPISPTCEYCCGSFCGKPAVIAYPAMGGGWMALCLEHGKKHLPQASMITDLLKKGEMLRGNASDDDSQRMKNLIHEHPSDDVRLAAIRLLDALCQWERSTGRKNLVILKDGTGYEYRSLSGSPPPDTITDAQIIEAYYNMPE